MRFHFLMLLLVVFVTLGMRGMANAATRSITIAGAPASGEEHCIVRPAGG